MLIPLLLKFALLPLLDSNKFDKLEILLHALFLLVNLFSQQRIFHFQDWNFFGNLLLQTLTSLFLLEQHPILHLLHPLNLHCQSVGSRSRSGLMMVHV